MKVDGQLVRAQLEQNVGDPAAIPARIYADYTDPAAILAKFYDGTIWQTISFSQNNTQEVRSIFSADSLVSTDDIALLSGASFTLTLPTAVGITGKMFQIVHVGTSLTQVYTLATTSSQTIGGIAGGSYALYTYGESIKVVSDGSNWVILDHKADTDWVDAGAITIDATTTAPDKGSNTIVVDKFWWRRVGNMLHGRFEYRHSATSGASAGSGDYLFTAVPANTTIDTTKCTVYTTPEGSGLLFFNGALGDAGGGDSASSAAGGATVPYNTTQVRLFAAGDASTGAIGSALFPMNNATVFYFANYQAPITGWQP